MASRIFAKRKPKVIKAVQETAKMGTVVRAFVKKASATSMHHGGEKEPPMSTLVRMRSSLDISRASVVNSLMQRQVALKETMSVDVKGALDPQSTFLKVWHQLLLAAIVYEFALIPFVVTFEPTVELAMTPEMVVFYACELLFCGDFWVKLNTGYYEDGSVHRDQRRSMLKYVKSVSFALDITAIIPLSLLPLRLPGQASKMYLELHKVFRLKRVPTYLSNIDDIYAKHFEPVRILKTIVATLLLSHYIACIRFWFGYDTHHDNHWLPKLPDQFPPSIRRQYLQSLFWGFGMLTGLFEGELPCGITQFIFTITVALCGFTVFTYLCGMFFMLTKCETGQTEEAEARINQLKHVMGFHQVPEHLRVQTIDYLKRYSTGAESNDRVALRLLCPSVAKDIQVELIKSTVARIPVFVGCSDEFLRALTNALEVMFLPARCTVFHVGDEGDAMYIIHAGVLDVIMGTVKVRELRKGDFVGEMSLFSDRDRSATVVTTTYSMLYKLSRFHTERVLDGYPRYVPVIRTSVMELIAKTDQQAASSETGYQPDDGHADTQPNERHGSVFASQLVRMVSSEVRRSAGLLQHKVTARAKATTSPDVSLTKTDSAKKSISRMAETARRVSFVGKLRRVLTARQQRGSDSVQVFRDQYSRRQPEASEVPTGWARLLLRTCVDGDSHLRFVWLIALQMVLVYDWVVTPLELAIPAVDVHTWYILLLNIVVDIVLVADIYLNFNLSYNINAEKIMDTSRSAARYLRAHCAIDVLLAFPYWVFNPTGNQGVIRIPHLLRIWRLTGHLREIEKLFHLNGKRKLVLFGFLLLMLCHIVACMYFSTTYVEGYSLVTDAWIPTNDIQLVQVSRTSLFLDAENRTVAAGSPEVERIAGMQYFRSFYYATNVLTGLGKTVEPVSDTQYTIALIFMFSGFIITAVVVDNVQKRFTASAFEQKMFFVKRTRIQIFLRRQDAPIAIHHRVNSYLDYWWSTHRGAHVEDLLVELPVAYRREIMRSICSPALQTLSLLGGVRPVLGELETVFVDCVQVVLYGQGEFVYHEGDNAHRIHFLLQGSVHLRKGLTTTKRVPQGGFFGTQALQGEVGASRYLENAVAASGCILIRLSRQDVERLRLVFNDIIVGLVQLEQRLLDSKLARFTSDAISSDKSGSGAPRPQWMSLLFDAIDPDSSAAIAWETWLFCAMTVQWVSTLYHTSFGVKPGHFAWVDGMNVFLEISFFVDVYVRCKMGYLEFGNKVMEVRRIRHRYFRSQVFVIDVAALFPLFAVNWMLRSARYELLNINKLLRLLKVPGQFRQLEQRYLKRTTELRIIKLGYYTFLAIHLSGCIYHDFASHLSTANLKEPDLEGRQTAFGWNNWLLVGSLKDASDGLRYFSSLFWSFGLMSASYQGELPKTVPQCLFSVMTMMSGFFLFAYVVGNFSDVLEIVDDETREFNARFGSMRHLLSHFTLPETVSTKLTGFFFFRRYHTITQENLIETSLPPSLVTDIRMLNLQPMIDKVPFMSGMEPAITRMLVAQFRQVLVLKDDFVYQCGDDGSDMFFVFTGILAVMSHRTTRKLDHRKATRWATAAVSPALEGDVDHRALREGSKLVSGDFFGENALFSDSPRIAFVFAKTSCILYSLSRQSLNVVFELYPNWKKQVMQSVKIQQKQHRIHNVIDEKVSAGMSGMSSRDDANDEDNEAVRILPLPPSHLGQVEAQSRWRRTIQRLWGSLRSGTDAQSPTHLRWLRVIVFCTVFNALLSPYRISIDPLERWTGLCVVVRVLDIFSDIMFVVDIWFNWHLKESALSIELYEQNLFETYKRERLVWDVISAAPIDYVLSAFASDVTIWFRLLRCVKVVNLNEYLNEIDRKSQSYEIARFGTIWLLCSIYLFWVACAFIALGVFGGFGSVWNAYAPSQEIAYFDQYNPDSHLVILRILRGVLYATTAFTKKAKTFYPETTWHLIFSITVSFIGTLVMAFMIGEMASLYISYIRNQVDFNKKQITLELFLARYKVSPALRDRVHSFLSTLWSSHAGVDYEDVLAELPVKMRTETITHIADAPLHAFVESVFRPLMRADANGVKALLSAIAHELKFEGYPRGEFVIAEGVINSSMFFVVHGHLVMSSTHPSVTVPDEPRFRKGQHFGEKGILSVSVSQFSVRALKACDLFALSGESLMGVIKSHPFLSLALRAADEVVTTLRSSSSDKRLLPTAMVVWKATLRDVLEKSRSEWVCSTSPSLSESDTMASTSRGATLWSALLVDILDGDLKDTSVLLFDQLFQLITPNGATFERSKLERQGRKASSLNTATSSARIRFRDMVFKLPKSDKSAKSARSMKVQSVRDVTDQVEAFVPED